MEFSALSARALEIRQRFSAREQARGGREWTTEQVMEGLVVDVGDLMRLVMAKSGIRHVDNLDAKLEHELADCLWSVLVLSHLYGIDLEKAFRRTMGELEVSLSKPAS